MGCCFSKKRRNRAAAGCDRRCEPEDRSPPSPEEETVKEVLSETPSAKPRPEPKPKPLVANAAVPKPKEREVVVEKKARKDPKPKEREVVVEKKARKEEEVSADAPAVSDLTSCVSLSLATDEVSEAASESSVATSSVMGPDRSPSWTKQPPARRRRPVSADLGPPRRDRSTTVGSYGGGGGVRSRSARGSPSPPPRHASRDRSARRSASPAANRTSSEQRRAASPVAAQRKPPVPVRPSSGRVSPRRAPQAEVPPPPPIVFPPSPPPPPPSHSQPEDDGVTVSSEVSVPNAGAGGDVQGGDRGVDGKESLENPLVSLECFIFL